MEVKKVFESKNQQELLAAMQANLFELCSAYLVNIFAALNNLNLRMQGCNHHVIAFHSTINAFRAKLKLWHTCAHVKNMVSFPHT